MTNVARHVRLQWAESGTARPEVGRELLRWTDGPLSREDLKDLASRMLIWNPPSASLAGGDELPWFSFAGISPRNGGTYIAATVFDRAPDRLVAGRQDFHLWVAVLPYDDVTEFRGLYSSLLGILTTESNLASMPTQLTVVDHDDEHLFHAGVDVASAVRMAARLQRGKAVVSSPVELDLAGRVLRLDQVMRTLPSGCRATTFVTSRDGANSQLPQLTFGQPQSRTRSGTRGETAPYELLWLELEAKLGVRSVLDRLFTHNQPTKVGDSATLLATLAAVDPSVAIRVAAGNAEVRQAVARFVETEIPEVDQRTARGVLDLVIREGTIEDIERYVKPKWTPALRQVLLVRIETEAEGAAASGTAIAQLLATPDDRKQTASLIESLLQRVNASHSIPLGIAEAIARWTIEADETDVRPVIVALWRGLAPIRERVAQFGMNGQSSELFASRLLDVAATDLKGGLPTLVALAQAAPDTPLPHARLVRAIERMDVSSSQLDALLGEADSLLSTAAGAALFDAVASAASPRVSASVDVALAAKGHRLPIDRIGRYGAADWSTYIDSWEARLRFRPEQGRAALIESIVGGLGRDAWSGDGGQRLIALLRVIVGDEFGGRAGLVERATRAIFKVAAHSPHLVETSEAIKWGADLHAHPSLAALWAVWRIRQRGAQPSPDELGALVAKALPFYQEEVAECLSSGAVAFPSASSFAAFLRSFRSQLVHRNSTADTTDRWTTQLCQLAVDGRFGDALPGKLVDWLDSAAVAEIELYMAMLGALPDRGQSRLHRLLESHTTSSLSNTGAVKPKHGLSRLKEKAANVLNSVRLREPDDIGPFVHEVKRAASKYPDQAQFSIFVPQALLASYDEADLINHAIKVVHDTRRDHSRVAIELSTTGTDRITVLPGTRTSPQKP